MFGNHFYHQTIRRAVSVFGTIFNDINIVRRDGSGNILNIVKVPLAYGPKQKFLARIEQQASLNDPKIAIKLPRMSFEITSMTYDANTKMQKGYASKYTNPSNPNLNETVIGPVGYRMGMQLNIITKNQDDALQILEQIIPYFQPEYTVTVKQVDDNFKSDMPIALQSVTLTDDYEGDYAARRAIIYSLDFETRVRFYGNIVNKEVIKNVITNFENIENDQSNTFLARQDVYVSPQTANKETDTHEKLVKYVGVVPENILLEMNTVSGFSKNDQVIGLTSGSIGYITNVDGSILTIAYPDGLFDIGETLSVVGASTTAIIQNQTEVWNT
jgi:hypothetical protein